MMTFHLLFRFIVLVVMLLGMISTMLGQATVIGQITCATVILHVDP